MKITGTEIGKQNSIVTKILVYIKFLVYGSIVAICLLAITYAFSYNRIVFSSQKKKPQSLLFLCWMYAESIGGEFPYKNEYLPHSIDELIENELITKEDLQVFLYVDPITKKKMNWLYFSNGKVNSKGEVLRLASPKPYKNKRIIILNDTLKLVVTEKEFLDFK